MSEETVPESVLAELDTQFIQAEHQADRLQANANQLQQDAETMRSHARAVAWLKEYMQERVGKPWGEVRTEIASELARVVKETATAETDLLGAQERHRDALGAVRWLRTLKDDAASATSTR